MFRPFGGGLSVVDQARLDAVESGRVAQQVFELELTEDVENFVSPGSRVIASGEFVPTDTEVMIDFSACALLLEGSCGHGNLEMYVGDPSLVPLTPDFEGDAAVGVTRIALGATSARIAPVGRRYKLSGLTPGDPLAIEVAVLIVGGAFVTPTPDGPYSYGDCSTDGRYGLQSPGRKPGDFFLFMRSGTKVSVIRSNHYAQPGEEVVLGSVTPTGTAIATRIACTSDGLKGVTPLYSVHKAAIVTNTLTGVPTLAEIALPASRTGPADVAITPDDTTAWVICNTSGHACKLNIAAGTFDDSKTVALGAAGLYASINPAGTRLYVVMAATRTIKVIDLTLGTPAVIATTAAIGASGSIQNLAIAPDGTKGYVAVGTGIYTVDLATDAVTGPVASGMTTPAMASIMSDGRTLMLADQSTAGSDTQLHQFNLPSLEKYHSWVNDLSIAQTKKAISQIVLSPNGSLFASNEQELNDWCGGSFSLREAWEEFNGEFFSCQIAPAEAAP